MRKYIEPPAQPAFVSGTRHACTHARTHAYAFDGAWCGDAPTPWPPSLLFHSLVIRSASLSRRFSLISFFFVSCRLSASSSPFLLHSLLQSPFTTLPSHPYPHRKAIDNTMRLISLPPSLPLSLSSFLSFPFPHSHPCTRAASYQSTDCLLQRPSLHCTPLPPTPLTPFTGNTAGALCWPEWA